MHVRGGLNLLEIQLQNSAQIRNIYRLFGSGVVGRETFAEVHSFPLEELLTACRRDQTPGKYQQDCYARAQEIAGAIMEKYGWRYSIFGPDRDNNGFTPADHNAKSYHNRHIWIYQPFSSSAVRSQSPAY